MLLNLLVQQPQMLGRIIENTPYWVWALLAGLLWLGGSQLWARSVGLARAMVMPVAMTGLSVYGITSAFGNAGQAWLPVGAWLMAAALITSVALWLQPAAPQGTLYEGRSRCFYIPGSAMPLALILGIFFTKYLVGVELALQPGLARDSVFALQIAALYGVFNGLFAARTLRLWKLVQRSASLGILPATTSASASVNA